MGYIGVFMKSQPQLKTLLSECIWGSQLGKNHPSTYRLQKKEKKTKKNCDLELIGSKVYLAKAPIEGDTTYAAILCRISFLNGRVGNFGAIL